MQKWHKLLSSIPTRFLLLFLFIDDRLEDIWTRLTFCEIHPALFLISHFLYNLLILLVVIAANLVFIANFSEIDVRGNYFDIFLILLILGIMGIVFGLLISVLSSNENASTYLTTNIAISCLTVGGRSKRNQSACLELIITSTAGLLWPIQAQPALMQQLQYFLPISMPGFALRAVMFKGSHLSHPIVRDGLAICLIWIVGMIVILSIVFKKCMHKF